MDVSALRLAFHGARGRASDGDFFLWHDLTGVLRARPRAWLRVVQAHGGRDDQTPAGGPRENGGDPRARNRIRAGDPPGALYGPGVRYSVGVRRNKMR